MEYQEKIDEQEKSFVLPVIKKATEELFKKDIITVEDLENFQTQHWNQMVPNFSQALKLLDIHGVTRHQLLWNINDRLLETIKSRIDAQSATENKSKKTQKLWHKLAKTGMVYVQHPYIRPLVMQVLGKMVSIKDRHINTILQNSKLYEDCPLPVLRHIWTAHPEKYITEISNVIESANSHFLNLFTDSLLSSISSTLSSNAENVAALYLPLKKRRKNTIISKIVNMIGDNEQLYDQTVEFLRNLHSEKLESYFTIIKSNSGPPAKKKKTKIPAKEDNNSFNSLTLISLFPICILRFDLLMSLLEAKLDEFSSKDPIHRIVWCLNASIRSRKIDQRHANELASHLHLQKMKSSNSEEDSKSKHSKSSSSKSTTEQVQTLMEKDLSMIIQDPWVLYTLFSTIIRLTLHGLYQDNLPRDQGELHFFVNLLSIGLADTVNPPAVIEMPKISTQPLTLDELTNSTPPPNTAAVMPRNMKEALMRLILPSMCRFQLSLWCHQVSEEIYSTCNKIWASNSSQSTRTGVLSPPSPSFKRKRTSSLSGKHSYSANSPPMSPNAEVFNPLQNEIVPLKWRRKLEEFDSFCNTPLSLQILMFQHPIGMLMVQYHVLFALERREYLTTKTILRAIAVYVHEQSRILRQGDVSGDTNDSSEKKSGKRNRSHSDIQQHNHQLFTFEWRPECLQAISLSLASMPSVINVKGDSTVDPVRRQISKSSSNSYAPTSEASETNLDSIFDSANDTNDGITRQEMVKLLKETLNINTDEFHMLIALQLSRLLPPNFQSASSSGDVLNHLPPLENILSPSIVQISDRERFIQLVSKSLKNKVPTENELDIVSETPLTSIVQNALHFCQKDLESTQTPQSSFTTALDIKFGFTNEKLTSSLHEPSPTIPTTSSPEGSNLMGPPTTRWAPPQYSSATLQSQPLLLDNYGPNIDAYSPMQRKPNYSVPMANVSVDLLATPLTNPGLSTSPLTPSHMPQTQSTSLHPQYSGILLEDNDQL